MNSSNNARSNRLGVGLGLAIVDLLRIEQMSSQLDKNIHMLNRDERYRSIRQTLFDECHRILLAPYHDVINLILNTMEHLNETCLQPAVDWHATNG